jgi:hypothetical protein
MEKGQIISDLKKNNCMLNISDNNASAQLDRYKTVKGLQLRPHYKILNRLITLIAIMHLLPCSYLGPKTYLEKGAVTEAGATVHKDTDNFLSR